MKRLRIFAGPNGSGKSTLFEGLKKSGEIHTDYYLSADRFEKTLREKGEFSFNAYGISVSDEEFKKHVANSTLLNKIGGTDILKSITIDSGILKLSLKEEAINSYIASFVTSFLAEKLIKLGKSFSFETVMSHQSKLDLIRAAKQQGYRTYLYFIATESYKLNIERVQLRVQQGGHNVDNTKVKERFFRSLELMKQAVSVCDRSYIIDNTYSFNLVYEIEKGSKVLKKSDKIPLWVSENISL
ncbi:MAG: zeta toxin family protein [Bacteroidota bacterium]